MRKLSVVPALLLLVFPLGEIRLAHAQAPRQPRALQIITPNLPLPIGGENYEFQLKAVGGKTPYRWSLRGEGLPAGLTLNPDTGVIAGTPDSTNQFSVLVEVADSSNPPLTYTKLLVARESAPLTVRWTVTAHVSQSNIVGALRVANGTNEEADMTVIVVAVNEIGKAFALRYEHLKLASKAETSDLSFSSSMPLGRYTVHADAVAEVLARKTIYRDRREISGLVVQTQ